VKVLTFLRRSSTAFVVHGGPPSLFTYEATSSAATDRASDPTRFANQELYALEIDEEGLMKLLTAT
jgi:hypothetical protein